MAAKPVCVKVGELKPGATVLAITGLSSEYSYLDSRRISALKEHFQGCKAVALRNGSEHTVSLDELAPGDEMKAITDIPSGIGFDDITDQMVGFLTSGGYIEVLATGIPQGEPVPRAEAGPPAPRPTTKEVPTFRSAKSLQHMKQVAQTRYFLAQVEEGEKSRGDSAEMLKRLFEQGRTGKYTVHPATEVVERIMQKDLSKAMGAVTGLKESDQTYAHCVDMAVLLNEAAQAMIKATGPAANNLVSRSTMVAGFLHDIGKSKIPREILENTKRYAVDSQEMQIMRSHVSHSAQILTDAGMDKSMINVAHYHHVKRDTSLPSSYPEVDYGEVTSLTRLAAIVDVYQALTGRRSYKKNWVPANAVAYLSELEGSEFDGAMLAQFLRVIGKYPTGSLVRLSTGDLAFVTSVEGQELDRPAVAIVENAKGELYASNPLLNLMEEQDISITEAVDHYEHYNDGPDQAFQVFRNINPV